MNKLIITTVRDKERRPVSYQLHDNETIFLTTSNLKVAQDAAQQLKLEYQREKQNASQV